MIILEGLDNLNRPAKHWALSDHMIFWLILVPAAFVATYMAIIPMVISIVIYLVFADCDHED